MAYREFQNEKPIESPVIGDMPRTLQALHTVVQTQQQQQNRQNDLIKAHKTLTGSGEVMKYVHGIDEYGAEGTRRFYSDIINKGRPSYETQQFLAHGEHLKAEAEANASKLSSLNKRVLENNDPYYLKTQDLDSVREVLHHDGKTPFGQDMINSDSAKLTDLESNIYSDENVLHNFNQGKATADFVTQQGLKKSKVTNKTQSGAETSSLSETPFVNQYGRPAITVEHLKDYENFHPKVKPYFQARVGEQLLKEIDQNRAADPNWMAGKSREEILGILMEHPELNPQSINKETIGPDGTVVKKTLTFGDRMRNLEAEQLRHHAKTTTELDTDYSNYNPGAQYGVKVKNIQASGDSFNPGDYAGPARAILQTNSATEPNITIRASSPVRLDTDTGQVITNNRPRYTKILSIQRVPVDRNGVPVKLPAGSEQDAYTAINNLPPDAFDPEKGGIVGTKMAIVGQSVDDKVLDLAFARQKQLESESVANPNDPKIQGTLSKLKEVLQQINLGEDFNEQFLQSQLPGNVRVLHNELIPVNPGDPYYAQIDARTGINMYSPQFQGKGMQNFANAVDKRVREAGPQIEQQRHQSMMTNQQQQSVQPAKPILGTQVPSVEEFNQKWSTLKVGDKMIGPDGIEYTKK